MKHFALSALAVIVLSVSTLAVPSVRGQETADSSAQLVQVAEFRHEATTKRAFLRSMLRSQLDSEPRGERRRLLRRLLGDEDLQTIAIAYADYRQSQDDTAAVEEGEDGKFFRFFQWMVENQDAVIAFIEKLIALFAGFEET